MTRRKNQGKSKRHWTERYRASGLLIERWTNAKAAYVGFLLGQRKMTTEISRILSDGTSPETIRTMQRRWKLPKLGTKSGHFIELTPVQLSRLESQAKEIGVPPEEWARRVLVCAIEDRMYEAVTDGRFDK
ncbi:hypothetical protein [Hoeflea sp.]|uniref:hypothetical protein n=1 Tax=Hoeflea sp. TaxID=1940281 RepID=UPI003B52DFD0